MTSPGFEARNWVRQAVTGMTGGAGTPASRDPLAVLRALVSLRAAVAQAERDAARQAREDGRSWGDIAEASGVADRPGLGASSAAERMFARLASDLGSGPSFAWTCKPLGDLAGCGNLISDGGPEMPLPDAERGHAEGCERFAATVAAWEESWADE